MNSWQHNCIESEPKSTVAFPLKGLHRKRAAAAGSYNANMCQEWASVLCDFMHHNYRHTQQMLFCSHKQQPPLQSNSYSLQQQRTSITSGNWATTAASSHDCKKHSSQQPSELYKDFTGTLAIQQILNCARFSNRSKQVHQYFIQHKNTLVSFVMHTGDHHKHPRAT